MPRYYNCLGAVAWVATRNREIARFLNENWEAAEDVLSRIVAVIMLDANLPCQAEAIKQASKARVIYVPLVEKAKRALKDKCREGELIAFGHRASDEDDRPVPALAWEKADINEVESNITRGGVTWAGLRFEVADLERLWHEDPTANVGPPRNATGRKPEYRKEIAKILALQELATQKAEERGEEPPREATHQQIADALSGRHGCKVPRETVSHNIRAIKRLNSGV